MATMAAIASRERGEKGEHGKVWLKQDQAGQRISACDRIYSFRVEKMSIALAAIGGNGAIMTKCPDIQ